MLDSPPPRLRVLVLDGQHRQALAVVRSLGRRRAEVTVAAPRPHVPAFDSRFCRRRLLAPDPCRDRDAFASWLLQTLRQTPQDALLFFDATTATLLVSQREKLRPLTGCPLPEPRVFEAYAARETLTRLAAALGVETAARAAAASQAVTPRRDYALLALLRRGDPVATFVHRLRDESSEQILPWFERPAVESAHHPEVRRLGLELLTRQQWDGLATVGFRHELHADRLVLLGLHPSWNEGIELAIASGIDMPWLYAQLAAGRPITGPTRYRVGRKRRRVFSPPRGHGLPESERLSTLRPDVGTELFFQDPLPHLPTIGRAAGWLRAHLRVRRRRLRRGGSRRPRRLLVVHGGRRDRDCDPAA